MDLVSFFVSHKELVAVDRSVLYQVTWLMSTLNI